jgi:hypothetical protein
VKTVATTLEVSHSQLSERLKGVGKLRGHYRIAGEAELLGPVCTLVNKRPIYGYQRITALLNRERLKAGHLPVNQKLIYRLIWQNNLLLQRYTSRPSSRAHEGKIVTIRPNLRRTSDGFEIVCWNGQVERAAFALDTCDREVVASRATTDGIGVEMIRDLIIQSIEFDIGTRLLSCSHRCAARNPTAFRRRSLRPLSETTSISSILLKHRLSWLSYRRGSRTTTKATLTWPANDFNTGVHPQLVSTLCLSGMTGQLNPTVAES